GVPELRDEREDPAPAVKPSERAGDVTLATFAPKVEVRHGAISRQGSGLRRQYLVRVAVPHRHLLADVHGRGEDQAAECVTSHMRNDVRPTRDGTDIGCHLGLRGWIGTGGLAGRRGPQVAGKVGAEIE